MKFTSLRPLSSKIPKYNILAFDIETLPTQNQDFLCGSIVGEYYNKWGNVQEIKEFFRDKLEMCEFIFNSPSFSSHAGTRIFATNLSFDIPAMTYGTKYYKKLEISKRGSRFLSVIIKNEGYKYIFWDTLSHCPSGVEDLGKTMNYPKMNKPSYINENRIPTSGEMEYIKEYNLRDSEISFKFISKLQKSYNELGCTLKTTMPSSSMDLFRRKHLKRPIWQEPDSQMDKEYNAYFGGRTEALQRGKIKDCQIYDFNSMYPSVMCDKYPDINSSHYVKFGSRRRIENENYEGVSEVDISAPTPRKLNIPLLSYRTEEKTIFPTGRFRGWYSHIELRKALDLGYTINKVYEQVYYTRTSFMFKEYVKNLYALRKTALENKDSFSALSYKLMMNALYGKFAQKTDNQKVKHLSTLKSYKELKKLLDMEGTNIHGDFISYRTKSKKPAFVMPIFSIHTTALGRLKLYEAMEKVNPIYMDTDSIITPDKMHTSTELGGLKLEHNITEGIIIRPKMYGFETEDGKYKIAVKGNSESRDMDFNQFKGWIPNPSSTSTRFSTFSRSLRLEEKPNQLYENTKTFSLEDDKRVWEKPFNPSELQNSKPLRISRF